jgi:hypothetical protein
MYEFTLTLSVTKRLAPMCEDAQRERCRRQRYGPIRDYLDSDKLLRIMISHSPTQSDGDKSPLHQLLRLFRKTKAWPPWLPVATSARPIVTAS